MLTMQTIRAQIMKVGLLIKTLKPINVHAAPAMTISCSLQTHNYVALVLQSCTPGTTLGGLDFNEAACHFILLSSNITNSLS